MAVLPNAGVSCGRRCSQNGNGLDPTRKHFTLISTEQENSPPPPAQHAGVDGLGAKVDILEVRMTNTNEQMTMMELLRETAKNFSSGVDLGKDLKPPPA